jgi:hypothetical protein
MNPKQRNWRQTILVLTGIASVVLVLIGIVFLER